MASATHTPTFGLTIGRALGRVAATTVHAGAVAATYTGNFGKDVATGTSLAYTEHSERLATLRLAAASARPASIAITPRKARAAVAA